MFAYYAKVTDINKKLSDFDSSVFENITISLEI